MTRPRYLLCVRCRRAWYAERAEWCAWCDEPPIDCSPWSSDARVWFRARLACIGERAARAVQTANFGDRDAMRRSLGRAIWAKGRAVVRCRAVDA